VIDLRYPVGQFVAPPSMSPGDRAAAIHVIATLPSQLRAIVERLTDPQLDSSYRPQGWTLRQVVHHLADSHIHSYVRFKLAATEPMPLVSDYDEVQWAELADARLSPVDTSLALLDALHARWGIFLRTLGPDDFVKSYRHPKRGLQSLDTTLAYYAWHCRHHLAHITGLMQTMGW
jgi:hypothetical protein